MEDHLHSLSETSKQTVLRDDERQSLRDSLIAHIDKNPEQEKAQNASRLSFLESRTGQVILLGIILFLLGMSISVLNPTIPKRVKNFIYNTILQKDTDSEQDIYKKLELSMN